MRWVFLSPHLDDAVLSCGGMIWELTRLGLQVEIWTVFAGDPPRGKLTPFARELHARWKLDDEEMLNAEGRRVEDAQACIRISADWRHFQWPDCIYRKAPGTNQPIVQKEEDLWFLPDNLEYYLIREIRETLLVELKKTDLVVAPMGLGNHRDHLLLNKVVGVFNPGVSYYADFPYSSSRINEETALREKYEPEKKILISSNGLSAWQAGISEYRSQISTFWKDLGEMEEDIQIYARQESSSFLWKTSISPERAL
ncbi:MAG: PIG-L family deacetylase [Anaerolineaceae bacterium]|nr:PIG-L family deacetylase [Anaerolineaceae bacterium]